MAMTGISEIFFKNVETPQKLNSQNNLSNEPILKFKENGNTELQKDISSAKLETEMFISKIMRRLDTSKMEDSPKNVRYYLGNLVRVAQILNGVQENNLKPNGNSEQNRVYDFRIKDLKNHLNDYVEFVGSGVSVMQDSRTGLYKLTINDKIYDIPKRKVEIQEVNTEDMIELLPDIVD